MSGIVYVRRNDRGAVQSVSLEQDEFHHERISDDSPEIEPFADSLGLKNEELVESDLSLIRVLEDLVEVLIDKDVIRFTDLPAAAQDKLLKRKSLRKIDISIDADDETI